MEYKLIVENWRKHLKEIGMSDAALGLKSEMPPPNAEDIRFMISLFDPTGIASYPDIPPAIEAWENDSSWFNGAMLVLALTAAVPVIGKGAKIASKGLAKYARRAHARALRRASRRGASPPGPYVSSALGLDIQQMLLKPSPSSGKKPPRGWTQDDENTWEIAMHEARIRLAHEAEQIARAMPKDSAQGAKIASEISRKADEIKSTTPKVDPTKSTDDIKYYTDATGKKYTSGAAFREYVITKLRKFNEPFEIAFGSQDFVGKPVKTGTKDSAGQIITLRYGGGNPMVRAHIDDHGEISWEFAKEALDNPSLRPSLQRIREKLENMDFKYIGSFEYW